MLNQYIEHTMAAGDVTGELVAAWSTSTPNAVDGPLIRKISISCAGPTFGITLYFAAIAAAAEEDIVVAYSTDAIDVTLVPPTAALVVANQVMDCPAGLVVPRLGDDLLAVPMSLFVSTSGKVDTGRIRVVWTWGNPL